jgi:heme o synthase
MTSHAARHLPLLSTSRTAAGFSTDGLGDRVRALVELTRPRIAAMVLFSTATGFLTATGGRWQLLTLIHALGGTCLLAGGASALNQWYERDTDGVMRRTRGRPMPSGRILPRDGMTFGMALSTAGLCELWMGANLLAAAVGLLTLASYLLAYTPLKRRSSWSVAVGAVPGALPPVIGSVAAAGTLTWSGLSLFSLLFVWQMPHAYAIGLMLRDDNRRAGLEMLPENPTSHVFVWSALLVPTGVMPAMAGFAGPGYVLVAATAGLLFLFHCARLVDEDTPRRAREVLLASVLYLPLLFAMMLIDASVATSPLRGLIG